MDEANWTQLEYLGWYNQYVKSDWEKFIEYAEENNFNYREISILNTVSRRMGSSNCPSFKQLKWVKGVVERIEKNI